MCTCLSVYPSICQSVCLLLPMSVCLSVRPSFSCTEYSAGPSINVPGISSLLNILSLFLHTPLCLCVCLSVSSCLCQPAYLSIYPSVCLSLLLPMFASLALRFYPPGFVSLKHSMIIRQNKSRWIPSPRLLPPRASPPPRLPPPPPPIPPAPTLLRHPLTQACITHSAICPSFKGIDRSYRGSQ